MNIDLLSTSARLRRGPAIPFNRNGRANWRWMMEMASFRASETLPLLPLATRKSDWHNLSALVPALWGMFNIQFNQRRSI
jgi:hypothetical protein